MKYCHKEFFNAIKTLTYPNYDILIIENSQDNEYFNELKQDSKIITLKYNPSETDKMLRIINSRNKIIQYALENNYEYILMMDSDVIPPKNIIQELLKHNKDIVSGIYFNYFVCSGKTKFLPVVWMPITFQEFENMKKQINFPPSVQSHLDLKRHMDQKEAESNDLLEVLFPSAGCMLISKKVYQNINYHPADTKKFGNIKTTDDTGFIIKARENRFKCYCDTSIKCDHILLNKFNKNSKGIYIHPAYN